MGAIQTSESFVLMRQYSKARSCSGQKAAQLRQVRKSVYQTGQDSRGTFGTQTSRRRVEEEAGE